jgi:hypothetical protein
LFDDSIFYKPSQYQAAGVLKKAEGILTIVVSNPKTAEPIKKEEPKPSKSFCLIYFTFLFYFSLKNLRCCPVGFSLWFKFI